MIITQYNPIYQKAIAELFTHTIHKTCNKDYSQTQLNAWANPNIDYETWAQRVEKTKPFLALMDEKLVGFCEFYDDYIDCFYVHHEHQGQGVGKALLTHIITLTEQQSIKSLRVDASITAKPFFESFGFTVLQKNKVARQGIILENFSMIKELHA